MLYELIGVVGLVFITLGVLLRKRGQQDILYILGGISLLAYSWSIGNMIFMSSQVVFTIVAIYDYMKRGIK